ncbi:unnamed protein product [Protopolystoma xenopodis]|uniref:Uncharacterized protein n=1 Tax=Protopolystoma xenopodis TaxID=117903 RepID=A0A3S5CLE4_9PLAT|nr:unnamed protein product [Protopolystoma xenopodis]
MTSESELTCNDSHSNTQETSKVDLWGSIIEIDPGQLNLVSFINQDLANEFQCTKRRFYRNHKHKPSSTKQTPKQKKEKRDNHLKDKMLIKLSAPEVAVSATVSDLAEEELTHLLPDLAEVARLAEMAAKDYLAAQRDWRLKRRRQLNSAAEDIQGEPENRVNEGVHCKTDTGTKQDLEDREKLAAKIKNEGQEEEGISKLASELTPQPYTKELGLNKISAQQAQLYCSTMRSLQFR